jgi:hypothetical protein
MSRFAGCLDFVVQKEVARRKATGARIAAFGLRLMAQDQGLADVMQKGRPPRSPTGKTTCAGPPRIKAMAYLWQKRRAKNRDRARSIGLSASKRDQQRVSGLESQLYKDRM